MQATNILKICTITLLYIIIAGCSGNGNSPVDPGIDDNPLLTDTASFERDYNGARAVWGLWQTEFNVETGEFRIIPLREATFHINIVNQLQVPNPPGIKLGVNAFNPSEGYIDLDVTITHPYPNSNLRVFDVRGIFMGSGQTNTGKADPSVIWPSADGFRLLNADGYTRWWNAQEFTSPGLFGYTPGTLGFPFTPEATVNPYKYFADVLGSQDTVAPSVGPENRGTFSTDLEPPKNTRNYKIRFPKQDGNPVYLTQYAIDASWAAPTGDSPPPKPIEDFPLDANLPEAFHIRADTTGTTAYYISDINNGGNVMLNLEVFDWGAQSNPNGIDGEIESIILESPTLFENPVEIPVSSVPGSQETSGIFQIEIENVQPSGLEGQEILVIVNSSSPDSYESPIGFAAYPEDAHLAAYAVIEIPISDKDPNVDSIWVLDPNGGEKWTVGAPAHIFWNWTGNFANVKIELSQNGGQTWEKTISESAPNTGEYHIVQVGNWVTEDAVIRISDAANGSVSDESDDSFLIEMPTNALEILSPNGGEEFETGDPMPISWIGDPDIDNVKIEISLDSGEEYSTVVESTPNDSGYEIASIPPEYASESCRIRISDTENPGISDESDDNFTVIGTIPYIKLKWPNGGDFWGAGSTHSVIWESSDLIGSINIDLSTDGGGTWPVNLATYAPNTGWIAINNIPELITDTARIRIEDANDPDVYDTSDEDFSIGYSGAVAEVLSPNGGEIFYAGTEYPVLYSVNSYYPNVKILLSTDGGNNFDFDIGTSWVPNKGIFFWTPMATMVSDQARIKIETDIQYFSDTSDSDFTVAHSVPDAPEGLTAWQGESPVGIYVDWNDEPFVTWNIYRDSVAVPYDTGIEVSDYFFTSDEIEQGVHYDIWVSAVNDGGESALAGPVEGWSCEPLIDKETQPTGVIASQGTYKNMILLTWDSYPDAIGYNIMRGTEVIQENWPYTYYEDYDVVTCVHYEYNVAAYDGCIASDYTSDVYGWTGAPNPPSGLSASKGAYPDKIVINWNPVAGVTKYRLYRDDFASPFDLITDGSTSYEDFDVLPNTDYYYRVQSWGGNDTYECFSGLSSMDVGNTCHVPSRPINVTATEETYPEKIVVQWDPVTDADEYNIYRNNWDEPYVTGFAGTEFEDIDAGACAGYYYRISAVSECGESDLSFAPGAHGSTQDGPPGIPQDLQASQGEYEGYVLIEWSHVPGAVQYDIYRDEWEEPVKTLEGEHFWEDHDAGYGEHYYKVRAINACEAGELSDEVMGYGCFPPNPPGNVTASTDKCDRITVSWDPVPGATGYNVYPAGFSNKLVENWPETSWDVFGVEPHVPQAFTVRAVNECGIGSGADSDDGMRLGSAVPTFAADHYPSSTIYQDKIEFWIEPVPFAVQYKIYRDDWQEPYDTVPAMPTTIYTDTDVEVGVVYEYRISSVSSDCGESALSLPAEPGWIIGPGCFALDEYTELFCTDDATFGFDFCTESPGEGLWVHYKLGSDSWQQIPVTGSDTSVTFPDLTPGPYTAYFELYKGDGPGEEQLFDTIEWDFTMDSPPEIHNFYCPPDDKVGPEGYEWNWVMFDPDAPPYGDDVLTVEFYLEGEGVTGYPVDLGEFAIEYDMPIDSLVNGEMYEAWIKVSDSCPWTVESVHCTFLYEDNPPPWVEITNCPGAFGIEDNCEGEYVFEWDMNDPSPETEPSDLWVRVHWTVTDQWYDLPKGTQSYTIEWDPCEYVNLFGTLTVQVTDTLDGWDISSDSDECEFDVPKVKGAQMEWDYTFPECGLYGDPFTIEWLMEDDCTPIDELEVEVIVNDEVYPQPDGTTSYDIVIFEPNTEVEIHTVDNCGRDGWLIDTLSMMYPPTVEISDCPGTVTTGSSVTFHWTSTEDGEPYIWAPYWVKVDDFDWVELENGTEEYTWNPVPAGEHTFQVKVRDSCYHEAIDICEFEAI